MSKYIDAEAVAAVARKKADGETNELKKFLTLGIAELMEELMAELPAVEVAEVRHGEWVYDEYEIAHCSECNFEFEDREFVTPYCPNCGAKMEEDS